MTVNKHSTEAGWVDPDDAPELTDAFFERADEFQGGTLIKRGRGRPKSSSSKVSVKLRLDPDVLEALRATGEGWQTRVNDTLRASLALVGHMGRR